MQYGYLLANARSEGPLLLTHVGSASYAAFNQTFIGNTVNNLWIQFTIHADNPPPNGFPFAVEIYPNLPSSFSGPESLDPGRWRSLLSGTGCDSSRW